MLKFRYASRASQGARPYQEDSAAVWPGTGPLVPTIGAPPEGTTLVSVLADGMGGHAGGALASATICSSFLARFASADGEGPSRLGACLLAANAAIGAKVRNNPSLAGMGATLVGVAIGSHGVSWVSVGDSPMYLFRNGELAQLNEDHSLAPLIDRMVEQGKMTAEAARLDPRRHYLRSAITGEEIELVDAPKRPLELTGGDILLIASDGIHTLEPSVIEGIIGQHATLGPDAVAAELVRAVDAAGEPHQDNTTVIVVEASV